VLRTRREGRELNIYDKAECLEAVRLLAKLHSSMELPADTPGLSPAFSPGKEYEKHNRELKRIQKYLRQKGQKTWFEFRLLTVFDPFLSQAQQTAREWEMFCGKSEDWADSQGRPGTVAFCHGDYQYHNIIKTGDGWFLAGFERCVRDDPVRDLCLFMRKLLEKSSWSIPLGRSLLETYEEIRPLSGESRADLYFRLSYPEKFWKIANFYYNSGKAWIPGRNQEKLEKVVSQEKDKRKFLEEVFRGEGR
jgi:CotS family spore coat protein